MQEYELKRKLRALKKLEEKIRFLDSGTASPQPAFIWDSYFSLKTQTSHYPGIPQKITPGSGLKAKYPLPRLQNLERAERKQIIEQYIYEVFVKSFQEGKICCAAAFYDPQILAVLNLPWNATGEEIKARFRQLAKQYHPDQGGEVENMIQLLEVYEKIFPKQY